MMNFASDNVAGASPKIIDALLKANVGAEAAYGSDSYTQRAETLLAELFETDVGVFLVATGTAANALALSALTPPWGAIFCHQESHVIDDECGAPELFTAGAKLVGIPGVGAKITPHEFKAALARFPRGVVKTSQPSAVSLAQVSEAGTLYQIDEIKELAEIAHANGLSVHLDGARFANALVALGATAAEMSWKAGVDVVSFGGTKNGMLACEAVIFFDRGKADGFQFRRKRGGHTLSKGRLLGAQMCAYLEDGHWLELARHTNAMAERLAAGLRAIEGVRLAWPAEANEIFPIMPRRIDAALRQAGFFYHPWSSLSLKPEECIGADEIFVRLVTSFATKVEDVDRFITVARSVASKPRFVLGSQRGD
jgi:threonine aldolase